MSDLKETGKHAYASISEMVAALECDYDRLDELKDAESLVPHIKGFIALATPRSRN